MQPNLMLEFIKELKSLVDAKLKDGGENFTPEEAVQAIGNLTAEKFGLESAAMLGVDWTEKVLSTKGAQFNLQMGELITKLAEISKTQREMSRVSHKMVEIGIDQLNETERGLTILDDVNFANSEKILGDLRAHLDLNVGVLINDTIKSPIRNEAGEIKTGYSGAIVFAVPDKKTGDMVIRTLMPSVSSPLTLSERVEFAIPVDLFLLAFSTKELNILHRAIDGEFESLGTDLIESIDNLEFKTGLKEEKLAKIKDILTLEEKTGYVLKGLSVEERPEEFTNPSTKEVERVQATNIIGIFIKRGDGIVAGDEPTDSLQVRAWRINEYDNEDIMGDEKLDVRTLVGGNGWELPRFEMNDAISKLSDHADKEWDAFEDKLTEK